jgi:hypothetical protein
MTNEVTTTTRNTIDGFDAFEDGIGSYLPNRIKFTNQATWTLNDEELPHDLELAVANIDRVVVKWGTDDGPPLETRLLGPGEKFPDIKKLNAETPQSEWRDGPNGRQGPWQAGYYVHFVNLTNMDMDRFTFPTSTIGGGIAVRELVDRTKLTRRFRGENVYPVITLGDKFMPTRFGGRQRPHFIHKQWITLGAAGALPVAPLPALTAPDADPAQASNKTETPDSSKQVDQSQKAASTQKRPRTVEPPSTKEILDDEIPF